MVHDPREAKLFPTLPSNVIEELGKHGQDITFQDGEEILAEGTQDYPFHVIVDGKARVTKRIGADDQVLALHGPGEFIGEMSMLTGAPSLARAVAVGTTRVIRVPVAEMRKLAAGSPIGKTIAMAVSRRSVELTGFVAQQEKLMALGKLSAGLAHELNNPAAAARRAACQLREEMDRWQELSLQNDCRFSEKQRAAILQARERLIAGREAQTHLDALDRADLEDSLVAWLERRNVARSTEIAAALVAAGAGADQLEQLGAELEGDVLSGAFEWIEGTLRISELAGDIENSMARISELVRAMKDYSYMDQSAFQEVDVHKGLDSTLKIFGPRLKQGIEIVREYERGLPKICGYAGELNQVWTNLISNAVDAMDGKGRLTLRTHSTQEGVVVEICDTGHGIPPENQPHIFEPFFTTKGSGEGTGLGLDISYRIVTARHHGEIGVKSSPGDTRFEVRIPFKQPKEEA